MFCHRHASLFSRWSWAGVEIVGLYGCETFTQWDFGIFSLWYFNTLALWYFVTLTSISSLDRQRRGWLTHSRHALYSPLALSCMKINKTGIFLLHKMESQPKLSQCRLPIYNLVTSNSAAVLLKRLSHYQVTLSNTLNRTLGVHTQLHTRLHARL